MSTDTAEPQNAESQEEKLELQTQVSKKGACERHYVVTVPRQEVDKQFRKAFDEIAPQAELPGFRVGKAPRKLLESRFRKQVSEQVKSTLVMQSLQQITEAGDISAISEPDMDFGAVQLPDSGDFTFEFSIEVRPEFDTPSWEGLALNRPTFTMSDDVVDQQLIRTLARFTEGEPIDSGAELGDRLLVNMTFSQNGQVLNRVEEDVIVLRQSLTLADCEAANFGEIMQGVKEDETRNLTAVIGDSSANEQMRGQTVDIEVNVLGVSRLSAETLPPSVLESFGFENLEELRGFVREELTKQQDFQQHQTLRTQITEQLLKDSNWELPDGLIDRQTNRELQRRVLEMRRNSVGEEEIKVAVNAMRRNARSETVRSLREHFLLEKIAEDLKLEPTAEEYEAEIQAIAAQSNTPIRRLRANLERSGQMDAIRNQIIERQVIDRIIAAAKLTDVEDSSFLKEAPTTSAIDVFAAPPQADMPTAKYADRPADKEKESSTVKLER